MLMTNPLQATEYFQADDENLHGAVGFSNVGNPSFSDIPSLRAELGLQKMSQHLISGPSNVPV